MPDRHFDAVTLFNSRPAITNSVISLTGPGATASTSLQAAISGDLDSFREDDTARGPLIRRTIIRSVTAARRKPRVSLKAARAIRPAAPKAPRISRPC